MKKLLKKIKFAAVQLIKGGLPLGNSVVNVVENITGKDLATGEPKDINWEKVLYKALGVAALIYLLAKGYIPVDDVLEYISSAF